MTMSSHYLNGRWSLFCKSHDGHTWIIDFLISKGGRALGAPDISEAHEFQVFFHSFSELFLKSPIKNKNCSAVSLQDVNRVVLKLSGNTVWCVLACFRASPMKFVPHPDTFHHYLCQSSWPEGGHVFTICLVIIWVTDISGSQDRVFIWPLRFPFKCGTKTVGKSCLCDFFTGLVGKPNLKNNKSNSRLLLWKRESTWEFLEKAVTFFLFVTHGLKTNYASGKRFNRYHETSAIERIFFFF